MSQTELNGKNGEGSESSLGLQDHTSPPADPIVAYIEIDRYCGDCGYNLRTQPVWRDDRTRLLLTRCPECGGFEAAARTTTATSPWLNRLATLGLLLWILALLGAFIGLSIAQGAVTYAVLEELAGWPGRQARRSIGSQYEYYEFYMAVTTAASFVLGFLVLQLCTVALHHWRRTSYVVLAWMHCLVVTAVIWVMWLDVAPHLADWGLKYIIGLAILRLAGAMLAVWLGRPLARLTVRVMLPPRARQVMAFLWFADGLHPPRNS